MATFTGHDRPARSRRDHWRAEMPGKRARPVRREAARKRTPDHGAPRCAAHPSEFGKDHFGLDHSQVRLYTALLRHIVLTLAALAVCAVTAAQAKVCSPAAI